MRFGPDVIHSNYLIDNADFIACHKFSFIEKSNLISKLKHGGTFLLNSPFTKDEIWDELAVQVQKTILEKEIKFYIIDANKVALGENLGKK